MIILRPEKENDYFESERITREAFWGKFEPDSCDEHFILHNRRNSKNFIKELDYVAEKDGEIVGNIIYCRGKIVDANGCEHEVISFGPFCAKKDYQRQGIGSALINKTFEIAKQMGFKAVILFGDPNYYHRFGFINAMEYGITTDNGENFEAFMALELIANGLKDISGKFIEDNGCEYNQKEFETFDKLFY